MALKLTSKGAVRFSWADDSMEALFVLKPEDSEDELLEKMQRMISFVQDRRKPPLPERTPGLALEMTQMTHPRLVPVTEEEGMAMKKANPGSVVNGWAAYAGADLAAPEIPEDRKGDWELMPPEEQGNG